MMILALVVAVATAIVFTRFTKGTREERLFAGITFGAFAFALTVMLELFLSE